MPYKQTETQAATSEQTQIVSEGCVSLQWIPQKFSEGREQEDRMELGQEEGHEEKRRGFHKLEAILISGENRSVAFCHGTVGKPVGWEQRKRAGRVKGRERDRVGF